MDKAAKRLRILALFPFILSPLFAWGSVIASDESAVFASLSRMIWFSGSALRIFIAMLVLFVPMLAAFFFAHDLCGLSKALHESFYRIMTPPDREMDTLSTYREKFYAHGLYGLLDEWIKRGFRETPEEMAEMLRQIVPGTEKRV